ncbi:MAG TPA: FAD-dependent oxidoreductase [Polyangia bacterium]|nr:FAD-dependent oxidoreductase [Polyangia bacterium]
MHDVVVVGAGIVGLTCAARLQQAGARVAVVTADEPAQTVSAIAAAVWYPSHVVSDQRLLGWARATFDELAAQADRGIPGVVMRPTRMLMRVTTAQRPGWAAAVRDFRVVTRARPFVEEWQFTVPSVEMKPYLAWLAQRITDGGGAWHRRRLTALDEAATLAPIVVNASGLGAAALASDPAVHPARGQIVVVANPGLDTSVRDEGNPAGMTYIHPRRSDVVLGGTYDAGESDRTPDRAVSQRILARCEILVPQLRGAPVLETLVGLRPARHGGIRLERDPVGLPGGAGLIHD